jgi:amino acid transporter
MQESSGEGNQLKRRWAQASLVALGIGAIIGAGLFSITGGAAAESSRSGNYHFFYCSSVGLRICRTLLR